MAQRSMRIRSARDLGAAIAEARQRRGLTQEELSEATRVDRTYLARIVTGRSVILLDRIFRLLRRLGVEVTVTLPEEEARGSD
jgi:HTH-type transcriptional regulator/antitoxin HipB